MTDTQNKTAPGLIPSQATGTGTANTLSRTAAPGTTAPQEQVEQALRARAGGATVAAAAPTLTPPGARAAGVTAGGAQAVTATWHSNVQITALWSIDEVRNSWAYVDGVGWKKLYNGSDGSFSALAALAAQARQTGANASLREEADGMIYEIYLW